MRRATWLASLSAMAACGGSAVGAGDAGPPAATDAGVGSQCQFLAAEALGTSGPNKGLRLAGQLHLVLRPSPSTEVVGVLLGPAVESGVAQRISASGDLVPPRPTLEVDLILADARVVTVTATLDQPLASCAGAIHGTTTGPDVGDVGTFVATSPRSPPPEAVSCVTGGADPLVCGVYIP